MHFYTSFSRRQAHKITDCNIDLLFTTYTTNTTDKTRQDKNDNTNTMKLSIAVTIISATVNAVSAGKAGKNSKGSKTTKTSKATSLSLSSSMSFEPTFKRCVPCITTFYDEVDCPTDIGYCEFTFLASGGPVDPIKCEKPSTPCTPNPEDVTPCAPCFFQAFVLPENTCASTSPIDNCIVEYPEDGPVTCEVVNQCPPPPGQTIKRCDWCALGGGLLYQVTCPTIDGICEYTGVFNDNSFPKFTATACDPSPQCELPDDNTGRICESCDFIPIFSPAVSCPSTDGGDFCFTEFSQDAPTTCEVVGQSEDDCPAIEPFIDSLEDIVKKMTHHNNL